MTRALNAQENAQPMAQSPADEDETRNTQRDTAGLVILHQQFRFSSTVDDISSSVAVACRDAPSVLLHIPIPLIGVLTPFVVHVAAQSV